jgi:membrane protease subunit HflK
MSIPKTAVNSFDNPWDETDKKPEAKKPDFVIHEKKGNSSNSKDQMPFNSNPKIVLSLIILLPLLAWLSTGFFIVEPDQEALIIRFGKYHTKASSGLSYKFPDPIDKAIKVSVTTINRELIGLTMQGGGVGTKSDDNNKINIPEESQMLTGDENIIDMHFFVQWKIKDAYNSIFKTRVDPSTLRVTAESAMREVIGLVKLNEAISEQRQDIEKQASVILQKMLDDYQTGIEVVNLGILYSYVPSEVKDAYRDIQAAKADKEREINQAYAYKNDILPKARGLVSAILEDAKGQKETIVSEAQGQANRFNSIQQEYQISPDITRKRIYIETMEKVLSEKDKVLISKGLSSSILPLLPIDKNK